MRLFFYKSLKMQPFKNIYKYILAFGSNVGDRHKNLHKSLILLNKYIVITKESSWKETKPLTHPQYDTSDHENYVNFICEAETHYNPLELYCIISEIEDAIGHPRERRWMPRSLDIDILLCAEFENKPFSECTPYPYSKEPNFFVPHRDYFNRSFWRDMVEDEFKIPKEQILKHFKFY